MMTITVQARKRDAAARPARAGGFTLLEMMVVIGLVSIMVAMSLPSVMALFNAGADAQAYNLVTAQLTASRARAVVDGTYAGIHVQLADAPLIESDTAEFPTLLRPKLQGVCFSGMLGYDPNTRSFDLIAAPTRIPGTVAFGYASKAVPASGTTDGLEATLGDKDDSPFTGAAGTLSKFTTFSVIFNPVGAVTRFANGEAIRLNPQSKAFSDYGVSAIDLELYGSQRMWRLTAAGSPLNYVQDRYGVTAMTMFDFTEYEAAGNSSKRLSYLNENAQVLPMNVHTGQLFKRD